MISSSKNCNRQLTFPETRKWDINDVHAQHIHIRIGEMMALDYQPFSIDEDVGFTRLLPCYALPSRRYMTETILPKLYDSIKRKVEEQLVNVAHISFTSDLWSTTLSVNSLISLTAHWLTDTFDRKRAVLHAGSFDETPYTREINRDV